MKAVSFFVLASSIVLLLLGAGLFIAAIGNFESFGHLGRWGQNAMLIGLFLLAMGIFFLFFAENKEREKRRGAR